MTEVTLESRLHVPDDVLFRNLDGEAVLVNLETATYFGLDPVGTRIWELIVEHGTLESVLQAILAEYEVEPERARADLLRLVGELAAKGLVSVELHGS